MPLTSRPGAARALPLGRTPLGRTLGCTLGRCAPPLCRNRAPPCSMAAAEMQRALLSVLTSFVAARRRMWRRSTWAHASRPSSAFLRPPALGCLVRDDPKLRRSSGAHRAGAVGRRSGARSAAMMGRRARPPCWVARLVGPRCSQLGRRPLPPALLRRRMLARHRRR